jgi:hypothetical protein
LQNKLAPYLHFFPFEIAYPIDIEMKCGKISPSNLATINRLWALPFIQLYVCLWPLVGIIVSTPNAWIGSIVMAAGCLFLWLSVMLIVRLMGADKDLNQNTIELIDYFIVLFGILQFGFAVANMLVGILYVAGVQIILVICVIVWANYFATRIGQEPLITMDA